MSKTARKVECTLQQHKVRQVVILTSLKNISLFCHRYIFHAYDDLKVCTYIKKLACHFFVSPLNYYNEMRTARCMKSITILFIFFVIRFKIFIISLVPLVCGKFPLWSVQSCNMCFFKLLHRTPISIVFFFSSKIATSGFSMTNSSELSLKKNHFALKKIIFLWF